MKRFFRISRYPAFLVFLLAGGAAVMVAYCSFNLLDLSMANLRFLRQHGWLAVTSGAWLQLLQIMFYGLVALAFYLLFKICESELVIRYRRWQER